MAGRFRLRDYFARHAPRNGQFYSIAIDGRGGSGKSTLSRFLLERYPSMVILHGDDYNEKRGSAWFGVANDSLLMADVMAPLQRGNRFTPRHYDWAAEAWTDPTEVVVADLFCAEACFAFDYPLDWDVRLWVEVKRTDALKRAVGRETVESGWTGPAAKYPDEWRQWQALEDAYIARVAPLQLATTVLDGTRPWHEQIE